MTAPLPDIDACWRQFGDAIADSQVAVLRRVARAMADGLDRDARAAVEGVVEWRKMKAAR